MKVIATGAVVLPEIIAGAWKFRSSGGMFVTNVAELALTAIDLVNLNPGGGTFHQVFVRSTASDELGICFTYEVGDEESTDSSDKEWMEVYIDFFRRRHGTAFKGYDIGHSVTEIVLMKS